MMFGQSLKVDAMGNVGIGTGTPGAKFHVLDGTANAFIKASSFAGGAATTIDFTGGNDGSFRMGSINTAANTFHGAVFQAFADADPNFSGQFYFDAGNTASSDLFFRTASFVRMAVKSSGNVGIGTSAPTEALEVIGNVKAAAFIVPSDKRLKSNVSDFNRGLKEVLKLKTVTFDYNGLGGTNANEHHVGLIAQDLQKVTPELVEEFTHQVIQDPTKEGGLKVLNEEKYLQIRDSEIKFMLINAIKDQHETITTQSEDIKELRSLVNQLTERIDGLTTIDNVKDVELSGDYSLAQNVPNPFRGSTKIDYSIPANSKSASIDFFNNAGQRLKTVNLEQFGKGSIDLTNSNLPSGVYSYTLSVDGQIIDTKKMSILR